MREDNDFTQEDIAKHLLCDQSLYSKYECGKRDVPLIVMYKLAKYYGTSIDYLTGLTDDKSPYKRSSNAR